MGNRKCTLKSCRAPIPKVADCQDPIQKKGFCGRGCWLDHQTAKGLKAVARKKAAEQSQVKRERRAIRRKKIEHNRNSLDWQHEQCQRVFNRMRVLEELKWFRDHGLEPTCISCNRPNMDWCCGHFKTRGAQSNLRYSRYNTALQCNWRCNRNLSGNIEGNKHTRGYKQGLIDRYGTEEGQKRIDYCETNTAPYKWSCEELERWRKEWNARIRELEKELDL